jgi:hypothetical protein
MHTPTKSASKLQTPSHDVAPLRALAHTVVELFKGRRRHNGVGNSLLGLTMPVFLLCGLPVRLAAISARFSSSSLPPSFAPGRRTTVFLPTGARRSHAPGARFISVHPGTSA